MEIAKKQIENGAEIENLHKCAPLNVAVEKGMQKFDCIDLLSYWNALNAQLDFFFTLLEIKDDFPFKKCILLNCVTILNSK